MSRYVVMNKSRLKVMFSSTTCALKSLVVVLLFGFSIRGYSQTIVNTYDLIRPIDSVWLAVTELQGSYAEGNGVFTSVNSGLGLGRVVGNSAEVWFLSGYNFASENGNQIYSNGFVNTRMHIHVSDNLMLQTFWQNQFNSALKISSRDLIGVNVAREIRKKKFRYQLGVGLFAENEVYIDESQMLLLRGNTSSSITASFDDVDINITIYYQPHITNISDYRLLGELALQFPVKENLLFEIESAIRFDSNPHLDLLTLDLSSIVGLVYTISN